MGPTPLNPQPQIQAQVGSPSNGAIHPQAPGTLPYAPPVAGQVVEGLGDFMTNLLRGKMAQRDAAKDKFTNALSMAQSGIPIDIKKVERWGRQAGILDAALTDPPDPAEVQAHQRMQAEDQAAQAAVPQMGQGQGVQTPMVAPPAPVQQLQQAPPGFMQRMLSGARNFVAGPPTSQMDLNSKAGQWMQNLVQAGQSGGGMVGRTQRAGEMDELQNVLAKHGIKVQDMSMDQQQMLMQLTKKGVMEGDSATLEKLNRTGIFKELPIDQFTQMMRRITPELPPDEVDKRAASAMLYHSMGGPQMKLAMMNMGKDMLPFMGNDMGKSMQYINDIFTKGNSEITPQVSTEQYRQVMEGQATLTKAYPTAPENLINAVTHAQLTGNKETEKSLMDLLSRYPREGTLDMKKHDDMVGVDYSRIKTEAGTAANRLGFDMISEVGKKNQQYIDDWLRIASDPKLDPTGDATRAAFDAMASTMDKDSVLKFKVGDQEIPLGPGDVQSMRNWRPTWPAGKPFLQMAQTPDAALAPYLTQSSTTARSSAIRQYAQQAASLPDGKERMQALGAIAQSLQSLPMPVRNALIKQLKLPDDMKPAVNEMANWPDQVNIGGSPFLK